MLILSCLCFNITKHIHLAFYLIKKNMCTHIKENIKVIIFIVLMRQSFIVCACVSRTNCTLHCSPDSLSGFFHMCEEISHLCSDSPAAMQRTGGLWKEQVCGNSLVGIYSQFSVSTWQTVGLFTQCIMFPM